MKPIRLAADVTGRVGAQRVGAGVDAGVLVLLELVHHAGGQRRGDPAGDVDEPGAAFFLVSLASRSK